MRWRRWTFWLLILAFLVFAFNRRLEIEEILRVLREGNIKWIVAAILLQIVYYLFYGKVLQLSFRIVGVKFAFPKIIPLLFVSIFVNNIIPSASLGAVSVFVDDAVHRGQSGALTVEGILLETVLEHFAILPFLVIGILVLLERRLLSEIEIAAIVIFLLYFIGMVVLLMIGLWFPAFLSRLLNWLKRTINSLLARFHRPFLSENWAAENAATLIGAAQTIVRKRKEVIKILGLAFLWELVNLVSLYFFFLAFGRPVSPAVVITGFALSFVFVVISLFPYDIALMQVVTILIYESLGVPASQAIVVVLAYGGVNAWLPLFLGFLLLPQIESFKGKK